MPKLCCLTEKFGQTQNSADSAADFSSGVLGNFVGGNWKFRRGELEISSEGIENFVGGDWKFRRRQPSFRCPNLA